MAVKLKEIAEELGISTASVSKVINNRPGVGPELRGKILKLLEEKKYGSKGGTDEFSDMKSTFVNLVVRNNYSFSTDPFYAIISDAIAKELQNYKISVRYFVQQENKINGKTFDEIFKNAYSIGNILLGADFLPEVFESLQKIRTPTLLVDCVHSAFSSVNPDNYSGAEEAANYLISLGHTDILFFSGPLEQTSIRNRYEGYCSAMNQRGYAAKVIECPGVSIEDGYKRIMQERSIAYSAIFAATDKIAIGVLKALKQRGISVPDDICVMGFDNTEWSNYTEPPLSTVHVPKQRIGMIASQLLVDMLKNDGMERITANVATRLVVRKSTETTKIRPKCE